MKAIIVNPNSEELHKMKEVIEAVHPEYSIEVFTDSMLAYQYAFNHHPIDCLYTVLGMKRLDGFSLARMMREDNQSLSINFCSYDNKALKDAEKFGCDCYFLLPLTQDSFRATESESEWELFGSDT